MKASQTAAFESKVLPSSTYKERRIRPPSPRFRAADVNESTRVVVTPLKLARISDGDVVGEGIVPNPTSVRLTI